MLKLIQCSATVYTLIVWSKSNALCCLALRLVVIMKVAEVSLSSGQQQVARTIALR